MHDNSFAGLGQSFAQSFKLEPGFGLYVLVFIMLVLVLVQMTMLERMEVTQKAAQRASIGEDSSPLP
jgi:hypothetical protein